MQDKTKNILITIIFVFCIIMTFVLNILEKDKQISVSERRKLAIFPKITVKDGRVFSEWNFDIWVNE